MFVAVKTEPYVLIFDTGPLWELIVYRAVNILGFEKLKPELRYLQSNSSYDRLSRFVERFRNRATTPQVVAEISTRVVRTDNQGQRDIWGVIFNEFVSMGMDERLIKLLEMAQETVAKYGAVDVSLLKLGSTYAPGATVVLSIDSALIAECNRSGLTARDLWEVIAPEM
jgi:hypothetical protein